LGFIVGNSGKILKTSDHGNNWSEIFSINSDDFYSVFSINEDTIYIGSTDLFYTNDGGTNWTKLPEFINEWLNISNGTKITDIYYKNSSKGFVHTPWYLYKYETQIWEQVVYKSLYDLQFTSSDIAYIVGYNFPGTGICHGFYKTTNCGYNWSFIQPSNCFQILTYDFINDDIGYLVTSNMELYKTIDGCNTWSQITSNISNDSITDCLFINEYCGYLTCKNGNIYKTTDKGLTWGVDYSSSDTLTSIFSTNNYLYVVGNNGTALRNQISLGVGDSFPQNNIVDIFPNPVKDFINISFSNKISAQTIISVIDIKGSKIFEQEYRDFGNKIRIADFHPESGIYFVRISTDQIVSTKKIIVN
jgi:photosystem II stability/assembly factor-like uncharacterized protein